MSSMTQTPAQMPPAPKPPKRHRRWPWVVGTLAALTIAGSILGSQGSSPKLPHDTSISTQAPSTQPSQAAAPAPAPRIATAKHVACVITGQVPASEFGEVMIDWGTGSDHHSTTLPSLAGKVSYRLPFDSQADYYTCDAIFDGQGHVTARLVVTGQGMYPTTVSKGRATGSTDSSGGDASAQAAPDDSHGTHWMDEG